MTPGFMMSTSSVTSGRCCANVVGATTLTRVERTSKLTKPRVIASLPVTVIELRFLSTSCGDSMNYDCLCQFPAQSESEKLTTCSPWYILDADTYLTASP